jgi:hypothetical protein
MSIDSSYSLDADVTEEQYERAGDDTDMCYIVEAGVEQVGS